MPKRPKPILELGDPLYAPGPFGEGVRAPGSAVLQPSLLIFGEYRTALQTFDSGDTTFSEWANRLDLFANLQLSGTERLLLGIRPLDQEGRFTSYNFEPDKNDGFDEHWNGRITTLFFEGDLGEILPGLDPMDSKGLDYGFSVGRQPLLVQDGLLIDDTIDSFGVTRNSLMHEGIPNLRITGILGWDDIHRDNNSKDESTYLFGLLTQADKGPSTFSADALWIVDENGDRDAAYLGAGAVQRIGHYNTTFRAVSSIPIHDETPEAGRGTLLFGEISRSPGPSDDIVYLDAFWGIDKFSSAARGPDAGGPLGRTGILFEAVGLGRYGAALGNRAEDSIGASIGYQQFLDETRRQVIYEIGGREGTAGNDESALAIGARYQQAIGRHTILRVDGFVAGRDSESSSAGFRIEVRFKF